MNSNESNKSDAAPSSELQSEPEPEPEPRSPGESQTYTVLEILCVFFWFLLDGFWLMEWKLLTYAFSVIAIATALLMFRFIKRERVIILIACADTSWLLLNILWAIGDLSKVHEALVAAKALFLVGGFLCFLAFCASESTKRLNLLILSRLRILKFFQKTGTT